LFSPWEEYPNSFWFSPLRAQLTITEAEEEEEGNSYIVPGLLGRSSFFGGTFSRRELN